MCGTSEADVLLAGHSQPIQRLLTQAARQRGTSVESYVAREDCADVHLTRQAAKTRFSDPGGSGIDCASGPRVEYAQHGIYDLPCTGKTPA
jgi:hypothetical protein